MTQIKAKKYYWLKLKEGFFREREMKKMRRHENGLSFTVIYLKMQLLSIKEAGYLIYEGTEENMFEQLALEIDEDEEMIKETIDFCVKNGLLEIDGNEYFLTRVPDVIGSESDSAERVRRHRENKQALQSNVTVTSGNALDTVELLSVTKCNTEIEKEKELDLERDIDLEKRLKEKREEYKKYN
ncbi:MAG: phage replisome organizer N-terminal domain-containing protein, partial [Firmicutes bacterium]|nr:phage replisome organizer N-terminal domain-containing protein [Bacillota bacterium]